MSHSELADLRKQCITSLYMCADNITRYLDSEKEDNFNKFRSYVEEYCLLEAQEDVAIQALEKAKRETDASNMETIEDRFNTNLSCLAGKRLNVDNHPYMVELKKRYEKGLQRTTHNLDESDLAITESQDQYIDPITMRPITDPVKNTVCGHIYEKEAIFKMISIKSRTKCPVACCGNRGPILEEHLVSDEELKFRMIDAAFHLNTRSIHSLDNTLQ